MQGSIFLDQELITDTSKKNVEELIQCKICLGVLITPMDCKQCETSYCEYCINKWLNIRLDCPACLCPLKLKKTHKQVQYLLDKLKFKCPNFCTKSSMYYSYDQIIKHLVKHCSVIKCKCPLGCNNDKFFNKGKLKVHLKAC